MYGILTLDFIMVSVYMNCLDLESPASDETSSSTQETEDSCKFLCFYPGV